jgi:hypothetical protein
MLQAEAVNGKRAVTFLTVTAFRTDVKIDRATQSAPCNGSAITAILTPLALVAPVGSPFLQAVASECTASAMRVVVAVDTQMTVVTGVVVVAPAYTADSVGRVGGKASAIAALTALVTVPAPEKV